MKKPKRDRSGTISVRISRELWERLAPHAEKQQRSSVNLAQYLLSAAISRLERKNADRC